MVPIYSQQEFDNSKKQDLLPIKCIECNNPFYISKKEIERVLRGKRTYMFKYCSQKCNGAYQTRIKVIDVKCAHCGKELRRQAKQVVKFQNQFCNRSCSATYNNTHKTKGTRVSKLEVWLKEQLTIKYPELEIKYNEKEIINSELDIYIPSLKLAFELNGIFHYEPIYGPEKLSQIQNNDDRKFQACLENKIELVIMDVSSINYWKPEKGKKYLSIINEIIKRKVPCMEHK